MTFPPGARSALLIVLLLVAATCAREAPARDMHATDLAPCGENASKQLTSLQSFITVHVACDHLLLEIPAAMLDRSILVYTEFAGLSDGASEQAPGGAVSNFVSRWIRSGNKVAITTVKYDSWAGDHAGLKLGVEAVSLPAVIDVFDVIREGDNGSSIIDITSLFTTNVRRGFALDFMRRYRMARVDGRRSFIRNVRAFPNNVEIGSYQTWVPDEQDLLKPPPDEDPPPPSLAFSFKTNFMLLPDQPMTGRCEDKRVGYFAVPFDDYSTDQHRVVRKAFINRFRLEKKHPAEAVSEPVQPIVFYLSPEIPAKWRPYLKRAVEQWQAPLERAGFKNAIVARDAPTETEDPDWDASDLRNSVIRWAPGPRENALGPNVVDTRSGEVISSHTLIWHDVMRLIEVWYFTQVGPLDPRAKKLPLPDDLEGELLVYVVGHEIGHALGLRHNFKAHSAYSVAQLRSREFTEKHGDSASIMDYSRFNYVAQPGDNAYLLPKISEYDYFAIEWGYKPIPGARNCDDEWPELDRAAAQQIDNPALRFGGEDDAAEVDPTVSTQVLGSDPIEATDMSLRNIDRVMPMLLPGTTDHGRSYRQLTEVYQALLLKRRSELASVAKLVGGVEETRYQAGRGGAPFQPVAAERQRKAVAFLIQRGFIRPAALLDPEVVLRIAPYGGADSLQETNEHLLKLLLDVDVFQRMAEASLLDGTTGSYQGLELLQDLNEGLFNELDAALPVVDLYRRDLQRRYVALLTSSFASGASDNDDDRHTEFTAALRAGIEDLANRVDLALTKVRDARTRAHLKDLKSALDKDS